MYVEKFNLNEKFMKKNEFSWPKLLKSERFWVMIAGALSVYLEAKGFIGEAERNLVATIASIFIAVRTYDRGKELETK